MPQLQHRRNTLLSFTVNFIILIFSRMKLLAHTNLYHIVPSSNMHCLLSVSIIRKFLLEGSFSNFFAKRSYWICLFNPKGFTNRSCFSMWTRQPPKLKVCFAGTNITLALKSIPLFMAAANILSLLSLNAMLYTTSALAVSLH